MQCRGRCNIKITPREPPPLRGGTCRGGGPRTPLVIIYIDNKIPSEKLVHIYCKKSTSAQAADTN